MKKLFTVCMVLLFITGTATLFAGGEKEQAAAEEGKIRLTLFEYSDLNDEVDVANTKVLFDTFAEQNPDIELEIEYGFDEPYHNKLQAMLVADQLPDMMFLWPDKRTGQVTGSGKIKDLRPWIEGHEDEFAEIAMTPQGPNGEIYELPEQVTATHVMFTNEKLLADLGLSFPRTLEELIAQGDAIRAAGLIPIAMDNGGGWQMQSCFLSALTERAGGMDWYRNAVSGDGAGFDDPEFVNALAVIDTLARNRMFSPGINQAEYGQALTDFVNERAVYFIDGGWRVNNLVGELTDEQKQYVTLKTIPNIPDQKGQSGSTAMVAGTGYGMHSRLEGEKAEAAWKWIWFYSGPVGSEIRQGFGALPAYKVPVASDADPMIRKLSEFVNNSPAGYVLDSVIEQEGMGVLHPALQEMIFGNKQPTQVAQEFEAWVAQNGASRQ